MDAPDDTPINDHVMLWFDVIGLSSRWWCLVDHRGPACCLWADDVRSLRLCDRRCVGCDHCLWCDHVVILFVLLMSGCRVYSLISGWLLVVMVLWWSRRMIVDGGLIVLLCSHLLWSVTVVGWCYVVIGLVSLGDDDLIRCVMNGGWYGYSFWGLVLVFLWWCVACGGWLWWLIVECLWWLIV